MAGNVLQSSDSLVKQMLPWAHMSSQDQYRITVPQIQTLTLHYIAPVPLQARRRHIESTPAMALVPVRVHVRHKEQENTIKSNTLLNKGGNKGEP